LCLLICFIQPSNGKTQMKSVTSIVPVILAAGDSRRMGHPKALLPLGSEVFITHILAILRRVALPCPVIILGNAASIIQPHIRNWPADIRINPDPGRGQLSSIRLALAHAGPEFSACMIWPVDQPAVSDDLVRRLTGSFLASDSRIACPVCRGQRGHPAIFHRSLFQEFMDAPLEEGPRKILLNHQHEMALVPTEEAGVIQDIDTPADYQSLTGESLESALTRSRRNRAF
jgi:molybdenum cofactor cytidylyltransferase